MDKEIKINMDNSQAINRNAIKYSVGKLLEQMFVDTKEEFRQSSVTIPFLFEKDNAETFTEDYPEGFYVCYDVKMLGDNFYDLVIDIIEHRYYLGKRLREEDTLELTDESISMVCDKLPLILKKLQPKLVAAPVCIDPISAMGYFGGRVVFNAEVKY